MKISRSPATAAQTLTLIFAILSLSGCNPLLGSSDNTDSSFHPGVPSGGGENSPLISTLAQSTYPLDGSSPPLIQGSTYALATVSSQDEDASGTPALSCTYRTLGLSASDPNYAAPGTSCGSLATLGTTNGTLVSTTLSTGGASISWTPTDTQRGTYEFSFTASEGALAASSETLIVTVRENDTTANLLAGLDALDATNAAGLSSGTASSPFASGSAASDWLDLLSAGPSAIESFGTAAPWSGVGTSSSPYGLQFNSANSDSLSLASVPGSSSAVGIEAWVQPGSPSSAGTVIASNGGGSGTGFALRQSTTPTSRAEFVVGEKYYTYQQLVLSDAPLLYWRMNETTGITADDSSAYGNNGAYAGGVTLGESGALSGNSDTAVAFDGSTGYAVSNAGLPNPSTSSFSAEAWIKFSSLAAQQNFLGQETGTGANGRAWIYLDPTNGLATYLGDTEHASGVIPSVGTWHHVVLTYSAGSPGTLSLYLDGVAVISSISVTAESANGGLLVGEAVVGGDFFSGDLGEVAVYDYALSATQIANHYQTGHAGNYVTYPGNAILADKPSGYWRLGEKSDATAYDLSGNGNNGTYTGGVTLGQTGALSEDSDTAALFDGSTGYVTMGTVAELEPTTAMSAEAWMNAGSTQPTYPMLVTNGQSDGEHGFNLFLSSNRASFIVLENGGSWGPCAAYSTTTYNDNTWHHLVGVYTGAEIEIYVDGVLKGSTACTNAGISYGTGPTAMLGHKSDGGSNDWYAGVLDEAAVYGYALSPTQISAHYDSGAGAGWWFCQSRTQLSSSSWNLLAGLWDGTTESLLVNGQEECQITPGATYSGVAASTTIGKDSGGDFWQGLLSTLKEFGSSVGAALSATGAWDDFVAEANRFRATAQESIVTDGMVLNLDAANAQAGIAPYANGCASGSLSWFDLSSSAADASLSGFSSCGSSLGWVGSGTVASPYALATNSSTGLAFNSNVSGTATSVTIDGWFYFSDLANYGTTFYNKGATWDATDGFYAQVTPGTGALLINTGPGGDYYYSNQAVSAGAWTHVAWVVNGTTYTTYVDGVAGIQMTVNAITPNASSAYDATSTAGDGSIAVLRVYDSALTQQQIQQNCLAQEHRFTSTPESICAAP